MPLREVAPTTGVRARTRSAPVQKRLNRAEPASVLTAPEFTGAMRLTCTISQAFAS